jgi:predicted nucleic acid-binding Zn ribbon protein
MDKNCLDCGVPITGRTDKKFCSDSCRNNYHNKYKTNNTTLVRKINGILRKNRQILISLNPRGKAKVPGTRLTERGFNFNYFTNVYKTKAGKVYYFCYDQGYLPLDDNYFALVQRENNGY